MAPIMGDGDPANGVFQPSELPWQSIAEGAGNIGARRIDEIHFDLQQLGCEFRIGVAAAAGVTSLVDDVATLDVAQGAQLDDDRFGGSARRRWIAEAQDANALDS